MPALADALQQKTALFTEIEVKGDETSDKGLFEGYLSVFGNVDSYKDIVEPGAFTKTINDARGRSGKYLFPILWQHDPKDPIGGIISMEERPKGLYIKGQLDLATQHGQQAYSGLKMGYLTGLSFGYDTIKFKNNGDIRHLLEVRMWEGSIVTFPANSETRVSDVKSACGSTDWPLGDRGEAWSGSSAHHEIVNWASKDDGSVDVGKLKSVHFYVDDGDPTKITSYKMPFCRIRDGSPVAIPRAITTCAAVMQGSMGGGDFGESEGGMKSKIASYYRKMASQFKDPSIKPPWESDAGSKGAEEMPGETPEEEQPDEEKYLPPMGIAPGGSPRDFHDVMKDREPDEVLEDLYDLMGALMTSVMENVYSGKDDDTCEAAITRSLSQFSDAVGDWLHDAWDAGLGGGGEDDDDEDSEDNEGEDDDEEEHTIDVHIHLDKDGQATVNKPANSVPSGASSAPLSLAHFTVSTRALKSAMRCYVKEGRTFSQGSRTRMAAALDSIISAAKDLQDMIDDTAPDTDTTKNNPDPDENDGKPASKKPATQSSASFGSTTTVDGGTQPADDQKSDEPASEQKDDEQELDEDDEREQKASEPQASTPEEQAIADEIEWLLIQMRSRINGKRDMQL